jgi:phytoene synthase
MMSRLARSYAYCDRVARREAGNFYHAFRLLPRTQRHGLAALYAFLRVTDDLVDGSGSGEAKCARLADWRRRLGQALAGRYSHRVHAALHATVAGRGIPAEYIEAALDGVEMDLGPVAYDTFSDLYQYCYRVASVVGLACIHVWGFADAKAKRYAEEVGVGFQLTNILRDLREDAARGRVYLPKEDLDRFGYAPEELRGAVRDERFRSLMRFEVGRARRYYDAARPLAALLPPPGRAAFLVMSRTYRGLLDAIERRGYDVFSRRVRLRPWHKWWLAARALPVRWARA